MRRGRAPSREPSGSGGRNSSVRRGTGPAGTRSCSVTKPDLMLSSTTSANSVRHRCAVGASARGLSIEMPRLAGGR